MFSDSIRALLKEVVFPLLLTSDSYKEKIDINNCIKHLLYTLLGPGPALKHILSP